MSNCLKILVCGNGPGSEKTGGPLEEFDHVVRLTNWKKNIQEVERYDGWAFYPWHHLGEKNGCYDFNDYLPVKSIWMPHYFFEVETKIITGQWPAVCIHKRDYEKLCDDVGYNSPTTGVVVLSMGINLGFDVYATGFNFYGGVENYGVHRPNLDKRWYERNEAEGNITTVRY